MVFRSKWMLVAAAVACFAVAGDSKPAQAGHGGFNISVGTGYGCYGPSYRSGFRHSGFNQHYRPTYRGFQSSNFRGGSYFPYHPRAAFPYGNQYNSFRGRYDLYRPGRWHYGGH